MVIPTTDDSQLENFDRNNSSIQQSENNYDNSFIKVDIMDERRRRPAEVKILKHGKLLKDN